MEGAQDYSTCQHSASPWSSCFSSAPKVKGWITSLRSQMLPSSAFQCIVPGLPCTKSSLEPAEGAQSMNLCLDFRKIREACVVKH